MLPLLLSYYSIGGLVHALDGLEHGLGVLDVPDHIDVGEVDEDELVFVIGNGLDDRVGYGRGAQLRALIVVPLWRGDRNPLFPGKGL